MSVKKIGLMHFFLFGRAGAAWGATFPSVAASLFRSDVGNVGSRRAVGLSVTMFFGVTRAVVIPPPATGSGGTILPPASASRQKSISTSIPLAGPSWTTSRFAAKGHFPSPGSSARAANPPPGGASSGRRWCNVSLRQLSARNVLSTLAYWVWGRGKVSVWGGRLFFCAVAGEIRGGLNGLNIGG